MAISVCEISITQDPLELAALRTNSVSGAVLDFWGVVRGIEDEREITGIEYEAHPAMAEHQMRRIAEHAVHEFNLARVLIHHRVGFVPAGEPSIVVRVESARRLAAFRANQWIMDEVKKAVPIWKHPVFKRGDASTNLSRERQRNADAKTPLA